MTTERFDQICNNVTAMSEPTCDFKEEARRSFFYKCTPSINFTTGDIELMESFGTFQDTMHRQILRTKEAVIRKALIALGWTPPPTDPEHPNSAPPKPAAPAP